MIKIKRGAIVDRNEKPLVLRGVNLGAWLMMEGYILGGRNIPEHEFKKQLTKLYGRQFVIKFSKAFRDSFIAKNDIRKIKDLGFNCVRLPFNYRILEEKGGPEYLKTAVEMIAKAGLYVILDMHAVPGSQNQDWHSDSDGNPQFWKNSKHQQKYVSLWTKLSNIFKNEKMIAGYDIMNEPVTKNVKLLAQIYQKTVDAIRSQGDQHIIFLEGNNWGMDIDFLSGIKGNDLAISAHFYQPAHFVFNWLPDTKYPGTVLGAKWDKKRLEGIIKKHSDFARKLGMPLHVGEFGIASRCECCGAEYVWLKDVMDIFRRYGIHWNYWTFKAVKGMKLPDGIFQLSDATGIIGNPCMRSGMDNYLVILKKQSKEFYKIWDLKNFKINQRVLDELLE